MIKARQTHNREAGSAAQTQISDLVEVSVYRHCLLPSMVSALALWIAFPPCSLSWLAFLAPIGWISVICAPASPGPRGYAAIWFSGCAFWLLALQGIRLAFWPLTFGWIALSLYLAVYVPLFVVTARVIINRWRMPLVIAVPFAWVGRELVRGYLVTGFSACLLAHTQVRYPMFLQIADQLGGYAVSFVVMMIAAGLFLLWSNLAKNECRIGWLEQKLQLAIVMAVTMLTLAYGWWRIIDTDQLADRSSPLLRVALIQENAPSIFDNPSEDRDIRSWNSYLEATRVAGSRDKELDLVIWPESIFSLDRNVWLESKIGEQLPVRHRQSGYTGDEIREFELRSKQRFAFKLAQVLSASHDGELMNPEQISQLTRPHLLVGCTTYIVNATQDKHLNSALLFSPAAQLVGRYDKIHLVMFGEYLPLTPWLDFLGNMFGFLPTEAGRAPACFNLAGIHLAPSICFESVLPHFLSWQIGALKAETKSPDILVNMTNDSWIRGSAILDHHLSCGIVASIEQRRPLLIAANCGLSAWIDGAGRVQAKSPRLSRDVILATPYRDNRWGLFQAIGDWPARLIALVCGWSLISAFRARKQNRSPSAAS